MYVRVYRCGFPVNINAKMILVSVEFEIQEADR
jgi:hypothetical protein